MKMLHTCTCMCTLYMYIPVPDKQADPNSVHNHRYNIRYIRIRSDVVDTYTFLRDYNTYTSERPASAGFFF